MIIRVQNKNGGGPYYQGWGSGKMDKMINRHCTKNGHPSPLNDVGIKRHVMIDEQCGFANWQQVINWFTADELKMMAKHGYYPEQIDVEPTVIGECQCLFRM